MCNSCHEHNHSHSHEPAIIQIMPVTKELFAVYSSKVSIEISSKITTGNIQIVPIVFLGLIKNGEKTMVEGFCASNVISSCEEIDGFIGYADSVEDAKKLYE
ncbi:MAG: hypothetical protein B6I31_03925 [Desulfobacteraceae bacterium 4572_19]|nr:MAG: hypothetical protein B6I31_03925 [Desulfobacteraceae bacterium 4572_19]